MTAPRGPVSDPRVLQAEERHRVRRVYQNYLRDPRALRRWIDDPGSRFMQAKKWALITATVREAGIDLAKARVLDVGSGSGQDSLRFLDLGVSPSRLVLLDLRMEALAEAHLRQSNLGTIVADASCLPFAAATFTVVYQSTMLSSVLEPRVRQAILSEVQRVLAPGGLFLSYDTRYSNPWNLHTVPVRHREVEAAVSGWRVRSRSVTALPQAVRLLAPFSTWACRFLEAVPPLRCHLLMTALKPGVGQAGSEV